LFGVAVIWWSRPLDGLFGPCPPRLFSAQTGISSRNATVRSGRWYMCIIRMRIRASPACIRGRHCMRTALCAHSAAPFTYPPR